MLAWPLRRRGSLPLRSLSLGRRRSVFPIYPIVVSDRLHLDIGDIVVGHFLLDGFDMLDQRVWAPDCGHVIGGGDTTARVNSDEHPGKTRLLADAATDLLDKKQFVWLKVRNRCPICVEEGLIDVVSLEKRM